MLLRLHKHSYACFESATVFTFSNLRMAYLVFLLLKNDPKMIQF